jgi:hypothetical protein
VYPVTEIPAGHVGVLVNKVGEDQSDFHYLTSAGKKGVLKEVKEPGTYYLNPYVYQVIPYNVRVQKTDFDRENELSLMSFDSYEVKMTATIEWRVDRDRASEVYTRIGDLEQVEKKLIVPYARSICRMIGSQSYAKEYIGGDTRQSIQSRFQEMLEEKGKEFGVIISSALIKKIFPPAVLREIINTRGLEKEKRQKFLKEIEKIKSDALVAKRREEIKQSQARVEENIKKQMGLTKMRGDREILLKQANKNKAISEVNLEVARVEKQTRIEKGKAGIIRDFNVRKASIEALRQRIESFGSGEAYAKYEFLKRIQIQEVFANDDSPLADMINRFGKKGETR